MGVRYIYNSSGDYVAFLFQDNLFDQNCKWIGFVSNGNEVYDTQGMFMGQITHDDRIVRDVTKRLIKQKMVPFKPFSPMKPLKPMKRFKMAPVPEPYIDVFEDKKVDMKVAFNQCKDKFQDLLNSKLVAYNNTFLGLVINNKYNPESIVNEYGEYGSRYSAKSIFSPYGEFGNNYGSFSPFNCYTMTVPKFVKDNKVIGRLSVNTNISGRIDTHEFIEWIEYLRSF